MYNHYYNDLEGSNRKSLKNNNNEVTHRSARNSLALKNPYHYWVKSKNPNTNLTARSQSRCCIGITLYHFDASVALALFMIVNNHVVFIIMVQFCTINDDEKYERSKY